jgi:hypothetical protein
MVATTFKPESYQLAFHHGLSEALLSDLAAHDLEVEIQIVHDEDALVAVEIVPEREPGDDTIKVVRDWRLEDFITTMKLPLAARAVDESSTSPFVRQSLPYELLEIASVPEASGVVPVVAPPAPSPRHDDFTRRHGTSEFAAFRPSASLANAWFTRTGDSLGPLDEYLPAAPSRAPLYVAVAAICVLALALGISIPLLAL